MTDNSLPSLSKKRERKGLAHGPAHHPAALLVAAGSLPFPLAALVAASAFLRPPRISVLCRFCPFPHSSTLSLLSCPPPPCLVVSLFAPRSLSFLSPLVSVPQILTSNLYTFFTLSSQQLFSLAWGKSSMFTGSFCTIHALAWMQPGFHVHLTEIALTHWKRL